MCVAAPAFVGALVTFQGHVPAERMSCVSASCVWLFLLLSDADVVPLSLLLEAKLSSLSSQAKYSSPSLEAISVWMRSICVGNSFLNPVELNILFWLEMKEGLSGHGPFCSLDFLQITSPFITNPIQILSILVWEGPV